MRIRVVDFVMISLVALMFAKPLAAQCCGSLEVIDAGGEAVYNGCPTAPTITTNFQFQCKDKNGEVLGFPVLGNVVKTGTGQCIQIPVQCSEEYWECPPQAYSNGVDASGSGFSWTGGARDAAVDSDASTCTGGAVCYLTTYHEATRNCPCSDCCVPPSGGCPSGMEFDEDACACRESSASPILISARGNRLELTSLKEGVNFDLNSDGDTERVSWTALGADGAFLCLDRNGNRAIDNGTELFGNFTPQPESPNPNGFEALKLFDKPDEGGNGDSWISSADAVFGDLILWTDANHDGVSQPSEMSTAGSGGIARISLNYVESRRTDRHGNSFRYTSLVKMEDNSAHAVRFAVDIFFLRQP